MMTDRLGKKIQLIGDDLGKLAVYAGLDAFYNLRK